MEENKICRNFNFIVTFNQLDPSSSHTSMCFCISCLYYV